MQIVKYGKKQRTVKVPTDWAFVVNGKQVKPGDKFFNPDTHCWDEVENGDTNKTVNDKMIVIRKYQKALPGEIEKDTRAVKVSV